MTVVTVIELVAVITGNDNSSVIINELEQAWQFRIHSLDTLSVQSMLYVHVPLCSVVSVALVLNNGTIRSNQSDICSSS
ncbi:hypothetical protein C469_13100 [Halorubrum lipolyticum DSM 21995]|uniref:Uncharacterized protein n=1 Tax=Halorubrum lipolyticum DSM 21995 TaxID=1227482 RepID=M0NKM8_9EURY|nr:hypothetical protein C469_13100 [Halorubrum lipolyticum DSM 21995]